jgi:hypothetical protein
MLVTLVCKRNAGLLKRSIVLVTGRPATTHVARATDLACQVDQQIVGVPFAAKRRGTNKMVVPQINLSGNRFDHRML